MAIKKSTVIEWFFTLLTVAIMGQTLYFKFSGAPESIYIFSVLKVEPWGRIGTGVLEAIACLILLIPRTRILGALMSVGLMSGAILSHLVFLGINVQDDGGTLFGLALLTWFSALIILFVNKDKLVSYLQSYLRANLRC